jgi:hypothetical protein
MHEIRVSIMSPEAADHGVAELWAAGELIGSTILDDSDLMLRIEPRHDRTPVVVGARSLARRPVEPSTYSSGSGPRRECVSAEARPPVGMASRRDSRQVRRRANANREDASGVYTTGAASSPSTSPNHGT